MARTKKVADNTPETAPVVEDAIVETPEVTYIKEECIEAIGEVDEIPSEVPNPVVTEFEKDHKYGLYKVTPEVADNASMWEIRDENNNIVIPGQFHKNKAEMLLRKLSK